MSFYHYVLAVFITCIAFAGCTSTSDDRSDTVRVMTYNIEDVRTADLQNPNNPRLRKAASVIQRLRPDILLVNEMTYDMPDAPNVPPDAAAGQNGQRFVENFLSVAQADSLEPIRYQPFMAPVNTGLSSGFDLNKDGDTVTTYPEPVSPRSSGAPVAQTPAGRAYGNDAWGFGVFPGQYGMALFVRDGLEIVRDSVRTFRLFRWSAMPDALRPMNPATGDPWYADAEWARMRLSSKSHWDVPIRLPGGRTLHVLASHPTPPGFDGADDRNGYRNHDEIRLWADYLSNRSYIEDDSSHSGGLPDEALFVVMGDQNADPDEGDTYQQPIHRVLQHERVQGGVVPTVASAGRAAYPDLDPDDTAEWGLRVDYVVPSVGLSVESSGVWRPIGADTTGVPVSDHFPVWIDLALGR